MKRILFFVTEDWYFVSHRLALAVAARRVGYDVAVVTRVRNHGKLIENAGLRLIPLELERRSTNPFVELGLLVRLARIYRRERPDIVHHVAMKPVVYGSIAARLVGVQYVVNAVTGLGWVFSSSRRWARPLGVIVRRILQVLLKRGVVIVQNPDDAAWLQRIGVAPARIRLIRGSGVDLTEYTPQPEPDSGAPVVLFASRMLRDKGVVEFVQAAALLRKRNVQARFILVGDPDLANPGSVQMSELRAWHEDGVVEWWGRRADMPHVFSVSSVVCLPSYYGEGIPKVLIEAAAAGRAIVTTDMPGCREIVRHGDNGILVRPRDVEALVDGLALLIGDPALRERMGARGRVRAEQEFSVENVIQQTLGLYRETPA